MLYPQDTLENLSTGVLVLDLERRVRYLNPAAQGLLGLSERSATGRRLAEILPASERLDPVIDRALAAAGACTQRELELPVPPDGHESRLLDCTATSVGEPRPGVVLEIIDRAREARIARDAAFPEATGITRNVVRRLAHEVKNPLGGLRGAAQLLARRLDDPDQQRFTEVIIREADRLRDLVDAMLGPTTATAPVSVNPHEILEHVRTVVASSVSEGVTIDREYDPSLPEVVVDRDQVTQAVLNLVINAAQAVGETGRIVLRTEPLRRFTIGRAVHRVVVSLSIEDDGPGVPAELTDRIFYPLVSGRPDGTGLGLAVAQELIDRQGGLIEYERVEARTCFRIVLPQERTETLDGS